MNELLDDVEVTIDRVTGGVTIWCPPAVPDEARIRVAKEVLDRHSRERLTGHHMSRYLCVEVQSILQRLVTRGELYKLGDKWHYRCLEDDPFEPMGIGGITGESDDGR